MLRLLFRAAQGALIGLAAYNAVTALWGWPDRSPASRGARRRRFRVVVPAHDEQSVVAGVVADVAVQDYPADLVETWVVADRCRDDTAEVAVAAGARVAERDEEPPGKGAALAWYLASHPLEGDEALVVLDADNRAPSGLLARFADELDAGHRVLQAYLDVSNPDASLLTTASALSYWAGNRMVQLARTNLGWSADLGGTGMCFTADALESVGGFGESLTEDQEIGARLALAGIPVVWLHDVRIRDEKPPTVAATVGQRARWMAGKRAVARRYAGRFLGEGVARRDPGLVDQAIRLLQPGRSFVALVSGVATVAAAAIGGGWFLPWPVWAAATGVQVLEPVPFLLRDGVPARYVVRYPLLVVLAALWAPIRFASRRTRGWFHTPHRGEGGVSPPPGPA
jgi:hypothetical protein